MGIGRQVVLAGKVGNTRRVIPRIRENRGERGGFASLKILRRPWVQAEWEKSWAAVRCALEGDENARLPRGGGRLIR